MLQFFLWSVQLSFEKWCEYTRMKVLRYSGVIGRRRKDATSGTGLGNLNEVNDGLLVIR